MSSGRGWLQRHQRSDAPAGRAEIGAIGDGSERVAMPCSGATPAAISALASSSGMFSASEATTAARAPVAATALTMAARAGVEAAIRHQAAIGPRLVENEEVEVEAGGAASR